MRRKLVCVLLAAMLLLSLTISAAAAEGTGSIRITLKKGGGEVALYRAGERVSGGYRLTEEFGGGLIKEEDALSTALAEWLAETAGEGGTRRLLDADRNAEFSKLEEGLYLIVQTETKDGYYPFNPFLLTLPYNGEWHMYAEPKNMLVETEAPNTGQGPAPFLGVLGMLASGSGLALCARRKRRK